jgi:hypothetical protein
MFLGMGTATDGAGHLTAGTNFPGSFVNAVPDSAIGPGNAPGTYFYYNAYNNQLWRFIPTFAGGLCASSTTPGKLYVDSDSGSTLFITGWVNNPGTGQYAGGLLLGVERTRDWDGTPNAEGAIAYTGNAYSLTVPQGTGGGDAWAMLIANSNQFNQPWGAGGTVVYQGNNNQNPTGPWIGQLILYTPLPGYFAPANTALVGSTVYTYPYIHPPTPKSNGPLRHVLGCFNGDIPSNVYNGVTVTGTLFGVSSTWLRTNTSLGSGTVLAKIS